MPNIQGTVMCSDRRCENQNFEIDTIRPAIWWCSYNWYAQIGDLTVKVPLILRSALDICSYSEDWYVVKGHVMVKLNFTHRWSDGEIANPAVLCASIYHCNPNLTLTLTLNLTHSNSWASCLKFALWSLKFKLNLNFVYVLYVKFCEISFTRYS